MMLTFAVIPQTRLGTGFKSTTNLTDKPSPPSPKPINHPQLADTFTPSAVKSRVGGSATEALEALKQALTSSNLEQEVREKAQRSLSRLEDFIERQQGQRQLVFQVITDLKEKFKDHSSLVDALTTLESSLRPKLDLTISSESQEITDAAVRRYGSK